jgi:hypothetical protein
MRESVGIILSSKDFFAQELEDACAKRKLETPPRVKTYLVGLLEFYLDARNLHDEAIDEAGNKKPTTLAEMFLLAQNSEPSTRFELLKKLGDRSLYLSGFFAESFSRKIIDIDYYVEMGETAYGQLSSLARKDVASQVYSVISNRFMEFSDLLQCISQRNQTLSDQGILKLYDRYIRTGSDLAREELLRRGVLPHGADSIKNQKVS